MNSSWEKKVSKVTTKKRKQQREGKDNPSLNFF